MRSRLGISISVGTLGLIECGPAAEKDQSPHHYCSILSPRLRRRRGDHRNTFVKGEAEHEGTVHISRTRSQARLSFPIRPFLTAGLTSSLGIHASVKSKSLARFCCDFLNLQRLAESVFSRFDRQLRHKRDKCFTQKFEIAGFAICHVGRHATARGSVRDDGSAGIRNAGNAWRVLQNRNHRHHQPKCLRPRVQEPGSAKPETPTSP
jgi:hypothetical protein